MTPKQQLAALRAAQSAGGKKAAAALTPEQKSERAKRAAAARWGNDKKEINAQLTVQFYGYSVQVATPRKAQMILTQARRERRDGDIDKWFYAGCPVGTAYKSWIAAK